MAMVLLHSLRLLVPFALVNGLAGCMLVVDFEDYQTSATTSGPAAGGNGGEGATGGTGAGGMLQGGDGGDGGEGGAGCNPDLLLTDPENCGACGWDCAGGSCDQGLCDSTFVAVANARQVVAFANDVLVTAGDSCDDDGQNDATILRFPTTFDAETTPTTTAETLDSCSLGWTHGPDKAYYAPQDSLDVLEVCTPSSCQRLDYDFSGQHINGVAPIGDEILLLPSVGLFSAPLDQDGVPSITTTPLATFASFGAGGQFVLYDEATDMVWMTTVGAGGCVYRVARNDLEGGMIGCFALDPEVFEPDRSTDQIALDGNGGAFVLTSYQRGVTVRELYHVDESGTATLFGPPDVTIPMKADGGFVYVGYPGGGFNMLDAASGDIVAGVFEQFAVDHLDPTHPDFVFCTNGAELRRWRKPPPRR